MYPPEMAGVVAAIRTAGRRSTRNSGASKFVRACSSKDSSLRFSDANSRLADFRRKESSQHQVLVTCEHASNALPEGYSWPEGDDWIKDTHWAYDPGAEEFSRELAEAMGSVAVLSRVSRLLCDVNRPIGSKTMFRDRADGQPVGLNAELSENERALRTWNFWVNYHRALAIVADEVEPRVGKG